MKKFIITEEEKNRILGMHQDHGYNSLNEQIPKPEVTNDPGVDRTKQDQFKNQADVLLNKIITKIRHLRTTIFLLQQNYQALDKSLRELASNLILFNVGRSQLDKICLESIQLNKNKYQELINFSFKEKHDWILINLNGQRNIYRMFDKIII
jgi:signal recognition particle GTPase